MSSDQEIILDLYHALNQILTFTQNMDKQEFIDDEKTQSSVLYQLLIMGEAVNRLSKQFKNQHFQIPFNEIRGMRNRVVHEYKEVDFDNLVYKTPNNLIKAAKQAEQEIAEGKF